MNIRPAVESEKTVLGAILLDNGVIRDVADRLCPKDFGIYFHEEIFDSIIRLHKKHGSVDVPMITGDLKLNQEHEAYVYELANECPSTRNIKAHADIVREKSIQRKLLKVSKEIKKQKEQAEEYIPQKEMLAKFLEETAAEIRATDANGLYLVSVLVEITKAISGSIQVMEHE